MIVHEIIGSRWAYLIREFKARQYKLGVEVGVAQGYFSKHLCRFVPGLQLFSVDAWKVFSGCTHGETAKTMEKLYYKAKARLYSFNCSLVRAWSLDAVQWFTDDILDFVFIDAAHDYQSVYRDLTQWSKKVKKGGIIAGHDYRDPQPEGSGYERKYYDVKHAVNDWCKSAQVDNLYILTKDASWFYIK